MSTKKTVEKDEKLDFERIYGELDSLISQLENNESMSLEDSLKAFESGIKLTRKAQETLRKAEQKVQLLLEKDKEMIVEPMDNDEETR